MSGFADLSPELEELQRDAADELNSMQKLTLLAQRIHTLQTENRKLKLDLQLDCLNCRKLFSANAQLLVKSHIMSRGQSPASSLSSSMLAPATTIPNEKENITNAETSQR